ncbi:MAG: hypothetical protein ABUT20_49240 [Bacteroidota bacterium]
MQEQKAGYLKSLKIIHTALLAGQCIFLAVMVFLVIRKSMRPVDPSLDKILQVVALLVSFAAVFVSINIFKKKLQNINATAENATEKSTPYRAANIMKWAMIEGASLFSIIGFFLTGNYSFAALAVFLIVFFAMQAPSKIKIMLHLQISEQEADELE